MDGSGKSRIRGPAGRCRVGALRSRRSILAAATAAALLAGWGAGSVASAPSAGLSSRVAAAIVDVAGPPAGIQCVVTGGGYIEPLGHADRARRLIELRPAICRRLDTLATGTTPLGSAAFDAEGEALLVAVHEAVHLSPYGARADEAHVECRAVQLVATTALRIGLGDARARALGHASWRADEQLPGPGNWKVGLGEMPSYRSQDCYDGGPLDIHPASHDWPN